MKGIVRAAAAVIGFCVLSVTGLVAAVLVDGNAEATESADGGGGLRGVPGEFRRWILKAAEECAEPELTPALMAAQLYQESKFQTNREQATSHAGAEGPAQFMPGTWATWGRDADGNGVASPWDIGDAVTAQGRMMCSLLKQAKKSGYGGDVRALALAGYNAGWGAVQNARGVPAITETQNYVKIILATMPRFLGPGLYEVSGSGDGADAVRRAATRLGTPYAWGGGGPNGPSTGFCDGTNGYLGGKCSASSTVGFDCSSLVQYSYWPSTHLPRTAAAQYGATSDRPVSRNNLKVGDLLFWSKSGSGAIHHVAMYAGDGNVIHAPRTGKNVEIVPLTSAMPERDYYGATRP
ncbi:NlpC/P60 family protein [Streptomyces sp. A012304]|uniref:bifunctional lytic transglycosylase/C40 family peptidase n=1 Tax=Streptomyces sp. A012304 TaxID=375446 RepID=UPI00223055BD|nr:NlpC/P60 family protein [Streptomyces sp. A012304]GKQ36554.1 transglycosylase [Streptomyces sp. A012304]